VWAANLFLGFISSLSVIQIAASGLVLWFKGDRRWQSLLGCVGVPLMIAFGYYMRADHYSFWFSSYGQPLNLIQANIPAGRLMTFFIVPVLIWIWDWRTNKSRELLFWPIFIWGWLIVIGYVSFLGVLMLFQTPPKGFEVSNRYLMALTPVGIIMVTVGILELVKRPQSMWTKLCVWGVVLMIILPRLSKVSHWIGVGIK
jgi:hypothetical protein